MWKQVFVQWWSKYLQHLAIKHKQLCSGGSVWRKSIEFSWLRSLRFCDFYSLCHNLILHYKHTKPLINENKGCLFWLTGCIHLDLSEKPWWINTLSVHTNAYPLMNICHYLMSFLLYVLKNILAKCFHIIKVNGDEDCKMTKKQHKSGAYILCMTL